VIILGGILKSLSKYIKEHYKRVYIKRELYEQLKALADSERTTVPDLIARMYKHYIQHNIIPNIRHNIQPNITEDSDIRGNIIPNIRHNTEGSIAQHVAQGGAKSRKSAFEIFMERGYVFFSDLARSRRVKDPERVYESIKRNAVMSGVRAVECDVEGDKVLLRADVWDAFKRKLSTVKTLDDKAVLDVLREEWEKRLYTLLVRSGVVHFDAKAKDWIFDTSMVREVAEEVGEEYTEDWEVD
jgi:hypothetical protein